MLVTDQTNGGGTVGTENGLAGSYLNGCINYDDLVEGALEGVVQHRETTRQRHLSGSTDNDIASSYFAAQFGTSQKQQRGSSATAAAQNGTRTGSRRNSVGRPPATNAAGPCTDSHVLSTMAVAAARIAALKQESTIPAGKPEQAADTKSPNAVNHTNNGAVNGELNGGGICNGNISNGMTECAVDEQRASRQRDAANTKVEQKRSRSNSRSRNGQFSYIDALPPDGSFPHRTQPIGEPVTDAAKSKEPGRKWSISSSMEYLNKTGKGNYAIRSNPIGLAEPSVKRDGYAVGKDGTVYRSSGNLTVAGGTRSRAASETPDRELRKQTNWKERRASSSEVSGVGIRVGGNLVEPSSKPPPCMFSMPFGTGKSTIKKKTTSHHCSSHMKHHQSATNINTRTEETTTKLAQVSQVLTNIQQSSESTANVTVSRRPRLRAQSLPRGQVTNEETTVIISLPGSRRVSRQNSVEPEAMRQKKLTRHGSVEIYDAAFNLTIPNKMSRHNSQSKLEEVRADHIIIPGHETVTETEIASSDNRKTSEVPEVRCLAVTVNKQPTVVSQSTGSEASFSIVNQVQSSQSSSISQQQTSQTVMTSKSTVATTSATSVTKQMSSSVKQEQMTCEMSSTSANYGTSSSSSVNHATAMQMSSSSSINQSSAMQMSSSVERSAVESVMSSSSQQSSTMVKSDFTAKTKAIGQSSSSQYSVQQASASSIEERSRSRHASGSNNVVLQGQRFNITNSLKRTSRQASVEDIKKLSQIEKGSDTANKDLTAGSALRSLDSALKNLSDKQQGKEQVEYVARVTSRQSSRRGSVQATGEDVTNVTVSLPPSRNASRAASRRGSSDLGKRGSRRNSLDIFTAEYAVKLAANKKVASMEQKTSFHLKVDNEEESGLKLCGRCHLPTHQTNDCREFNDAKCPRCLSWDHWEDSCPALCPPQLVCERCNCSGHVQEIHDAEDFKQRRAIVDALGWEPVQNWFYEEDFRNWWQVTGCVGVPLYRLYPRKTAWKTDRPKPVPADPQQGPASAIRRDDSVDDMIAQVLNKKRAPPPSYSRGSSGRSTPEHIRNIEIKLDDEESGTGSSVPKNRTRTFSETLKLLDDDIVSELNLK